MKKPHMLNNEIEAFIQLCKKEARKTDVLHILEWGSGYSTLYFSTKLKEFGIPFTWTAIEHHPQWAKDVREMTKGIKNITLIKAPLGETYIQAPTKRYDIALIDGRMRMRCIARAKEISKVTVLHDAQRKSYPAHGTYIASRLKVIGKENALSKILPLIWKLRIFIWKNTKARFV